jgi:hypothetical protein
MEKNCIVPPPIKFNCWKHHALFIKNELKKFRSEAHITDLLARSLKIGESQMDLYYGLYSPNEIANQVIKHLISISIRNNKEYKNWLYKDGNEFQKIILNDNSVWTLRNSDEEKRYVHIHPGRYSPHTVRVKALTLKTAIFVLARSKERTVSTLDMILINEVRNIYLEASPLKSVSAEKGLGKLITLLSTLGE